MYYLILLNSKCIHIHDFVYLDIFISPGEFDDRCSSVCLLLLLFVLNFVILNNYGIINPGLWTSESVSFLLQTSEWTHKIWLFHSAPDCYGFPKSLSPIFELGSHSHSVLFFSHSGLVLITLIIISFLLGSVQSEIYDSDYNDRSFHRIRLSSMWFCSNYAKVRVSIWQQSEQHLWVSRFQPGSSWLNSTFFYPGHARARGKFLSSAYRIFCHFPCSNLSLHYI